jgi:hypothetical protein
LLPPPTHFLSSRTLLALSFQLPTVLHHQANMLPLNRSIIFLIVVVTFLCVFSPIFYCCTIWEIVQYISLFLVGTFHVKPLVCFFHIVLDVVLMLQYVLFSKELTIVINIAFLFPLIVYIPLLKNSYYFVFYFIFYFYFFLLHNYSVLPPLKTILNYSQTS